MSEVELLKVIIEELPTLDAAARQRVLSYAQSIDRDIMATANEQKRAAREAARGAVE